MTVHFIGAGPGAPDLITLRGRDLIARAPVVLYAGSLVPKEVVACAPPPRATSWWRSTIRCPGAGPGNWFGPWKFCAGIGRRRLPSS